MLKKKIYLDYMEIFITFVVGEAFELASSSDSMGKTKSASLDN